MLRIMKDRESNKKVKSWGYGVKLGFGGKNQVQSGCILAMSMLIASHAGRQWDHGKSHVTNVSQNFLQLVHSVSSTVLHNSSHLSVNY